MKNLNGMMSGVRFVSGIGFVQDNGGGAGVGNLGDDSAVMMISGLGDAPAASQSQAISVISGSFDQLKMTMNEKYKFFGIELPLWLWVLIAVGAVGAGAVFFGKKHIKKLLG